MGKKKTKIISGPSSVPEGQPMTIREAFSDMLKTFQSEIGINSANLNALYNSQMTEIVKNFANTELQLITLVKKVKTLQEENVDLKKKLGIKESSKVVKPVAIIQTKKIKKIKRHT